MKYLLTLLLIAGAVMPLVMMGFKQISGKKAKYAFLVNGLSFFSLCAIFGTTDMVTSVMAVGATATAAVSGSDGWKYLGAALSTGLACIGGGIAVASAASAALGALSEDPKIMGKALIFVALAEGIALYGVIISIMILNS